VIFITFDILFVWGISFISFKSVFVVYCIVSEHTGKAPHPQARDKKKKKMSDEEIICRLSMYKPFSNHYVVFYYI
jgi:hypothetical protein